MPYWWAWLISLIAIAGVAAMYRVERETHGDWAYLEIAAICSFIGGLCLIAILTVLAIKGFIGWDDP